MIEELKKCIDNNMDYLERDDLDGFYQALQRDAYDMKLSNEDIGACTEFFENECGINTMSALSSIPRYYCYHVKTLPKSMVQSGVLRFPSHIDTIYALGFSATGGYNIIDLRGIKYIKNMAFSYLVEDIEQLIFDKSIDFTIWNPTVVHNAFFHTTVKKIYLPDNDKFDENVNTLLNFNWTPGTEPEFERY